MIPNCPPQAKIFGVLLTKNTFLKRNSDVADPKLQQQKTAFGGTSDSPPAAAGLNPPTPSDLSGTH